MIFIGAMTGFIFQEKEISEDKFKHFIFKVEKYCTCYLGI